MTTNLKDTSLREVDPYEKAIEKQKQQMMIRNTKKIPNLINKDQKKGKNAIDQGFITKTFDERNGIQNTMIFSEQLDMQNKSSRFDKEVPIDKSAIEDISQSYLEERQSQLDVLRKAQHDGVGPKSRMSDWIARSLSRAKDLNNTSVFSNQSMILSKKIDAEQEEEGEKHFGYIFTGDSEGYFSQWRSDNLECVKQYDQIGQGCIWTMDVTHDKKFIFLGDDCGNMYQYNIKDQMLYKKYPKAHDFALYVICIAKGKKYSDNLFTVGKKGYLKQWSIQNGEIIKSYGKIHERAVFSMVSSHDGAFIYAAGQYGFLKQFSVEKKTLVREFDRIHEHAIYAMVLAYDNRTLFTTDSKGTLREFNVMSGKLVKDHKIIAKNDIWRVCL